MSKEKWMYQIGESDVWLNDQYGTKEEAMEACKKEYEYDPKEYEGKTCYVGRVDTYNAFIDADGIIEHIQDDAWSECGEVAEGFLSDVTKEQTEELQNKLNDVLQEWLTKHNLQPTFGDMVDIEEIPMIPNCPICDKEFELEEKEDEQGMKHYYCNKCEHKFI